MNKWWKSCRCDNVTKHFGVPGPAFIDLHKGQFSEMKRQFLEYVSNLRQQKTSLPVPGSDTLTMPVMSERCAQEDRTLSDYSWRTHDELHDKSWDTEHTIQGTLQPTFYYKTRQSSIITFKSRDYDSRMAHQSRSPFTQLWKPLIDVWLQLLRPATRGTYIPKW